MHQSPEQPLREAISQWDIAMTHNDPGDIGRYMKDDWVIVGTDGSIDTKDKFLARVRSGPVYPAAGFKGRRFS